MGCRQKYKVFCPLCGRDLFDSSENWGIELKCPKCEARLRIKFMNGILTVSDQNLVAKYK